MHKNSTNAYLLIIDQGTSGTGIFLLDRRKRKLQCLSDLNYPLTSPKFGWVESRGQDIWDSVAKGFKKIPKSDLTKVEGISITNQRETFLFWDARGNPLSPAISWQCQRGDEVIRQLSLKAEDIALLKKKTGLNLSSYFSAPKIAAVCNSQPELRKELCKKNIFWGTIDSYLIFKLTGGHHYVTDHSNASRTQLFNLHTQTWDKWLFDLWGIEFDQRPRINCSQDYFGKTKDVPGLPNDIPIVSVMGDQQAALFGSASCKEGQAKLTLGTGAFFLMNVGKHAQTIIPSALTTVAWTGKKIRQSPTYAIEGSAFHFSTVLNWLQRGGFFKTFKDLDLSLKKNLKASSALFIPGFSGMGAPFWKSNIPPQFTQLSLEMTQHHWIRSAVEGIVFANIALIQSIEQELSIKIRELKMDGGASRSKEILKLHSSLLHRPVYFHDNPDKTAYGVGLMGGLTLGWWSEKELMNQKNTIKKIMAFPTKDLMGRYTSWLSLIRSM